jgi:hypothetical protein
MSKPDPSRPKLVREPVQAYLAGDDVELLNRMTEETGLSKAEILRRGLRSFAAEQGGESPMLRFMGAQDTRGWPDSAAAGHDELLAEAYKAPRKRKK